MNTEKGDIHQVLLKTACDAFVKKGYKAVSNREISGKSGVGLNNIYNYFESKKELFRVVLTPFLHISCVWWVNVLKEIARHDELTEAEIERFITEYLRFSAAGREALIKVSE